MGKTAPCYKNGIDCPLRCDICHAQCKEYHDWAAEQRQLKENARSKMEGAAYAVDNYEKRKRRLKSK